MHRNEMKKCTKCCGEIEIGHPDEDYQWNQGTNYFQPRYGPRIWAHEFKNCGCVEFCEESEDSGSLRKEGVNG